MHPIPAMSACFSVLSYAGSWISCPEVPVEHLLNNKAGCMPNAPGRHDFLGPAKFGNKDWLVEGIVFFSPFCASGQLTTCYIPRLFHTGSSGSFLLIILRLIHHVPNLRIEFASLIIQAVVTTMINHNDLPGNCNHQSFTAKNASNVGTPHFQPRRGLTCVVFHFAVSTRCPGVGHHETFLSQFKSKLVCIL